VSWRVALGSVVGLLLPVPLLLLLAGVSAEGLRQPRPGDSRLSPVLSFEERASRSTYHRPCLKASDCEPPLGCLGDARLGSLYCTDSECLTDTQCPEGSVCRVLPTLEGSPWVRFCVPVGVRQEGERCVDLPSERAKACGPGLLCGGTGLGWCGRPCRRGEPSGCAEGFFCADIPPEPLCLPSCQERGCPAGQQCIRSDRDEGASACAVVRGVNCQQSQCPEGQKCRALFATQHPGEAWMECVQSCGPDRPTCPEGQVCERRKCRRPCEPEVPGVCGEGFRCARKKADTPFVCEPDWEE
jgi:hypothetical protein